MKGLLLEIKLQWRGGFYAAYGVLTFLFLALLFILPQGARETGFSLIVLMDPSFMGFFFAGGLVLLELDQGVLGVIQTHGRGYGAYWRNKVGAILLLALLVVGVLLGASWILDLVKLSSHDILLLLLGVVLTVPAFFGIGVFLAGLFPRILDYFLWASILLFPLMYPFLELAGVSLGWLGVFSPVWGALILITSVSAGGASVWSIVLAIGSLVLWNILAYQFGRYGFNKLVSGGRNLFGSKKKKLVLKEKISGNSGLTSTAADIRLLFREPINGLLLLAPLLASGALGRGIPWLLGPESVFAGMIPLAVGEGVLPFMSNIRSFALLLGVVMYGMIGAFLMLDEKDGGVLPFLKTLPGPKGWYLIRRGSFLLGLWVLALPLVILVGDLYQGSLLPFILSLAVDALLLLVTFFGISLIAANKIQGLAMAKIFNLCTLPPLLMIAVPDSWKWTLGIFPTGWGTLIRILPLPPIQLALALVLGLGINGALTFFLFQRARRE